MCQVEKSMFSPYPGIHPLLSISKVEAITPVNEVRETARMKIIAYFLATPC